MLALRKAAKLTCTEFYEFLPFFADHHNHYQTWPDLIRKRIRNNKRQYALRTGRVFSDPIRILTDPKFKDDKTSVSL